MGRVIDGKWVTEDLGTDAQGRYVRRAAKFRGRLSADGSTGFAAEPGRYHLYVSHACGWSHRTLLFLRLKQLESLISVSYAEPFMGEQGWTFAPGADEVLAKSKLHEVYTAHQHDYTGRASVPVLWDRKTGSIVTNESSDIARDLDHVFDGLGANPQRYFPDDLREAIDDMIAANYGPINNGVYRCGFAGSQLAYDEGIAALFERLEQLDRLLAGQRYLLGDRLTAADLFLFPTLYRFDSIYYVHFKCCIKQLREFEHLWAYTRELYQLPSVAETCDMAKTRAHYYASHESIHPRRYVPSGPRIDFEQPHGRETMVSTTRPRSST